MYIHICPGLSSGTLGSFSERKCQELCALKYAVEIKSISYNCDKDNKNKKAQREFVK
jgi:hypothetical protein